VKRIFEVVLKDRFVISGVLGKHRSTLWVNYHISPGASAIDSTQLHLA
jgi:hypothetical protein